MTEHLSHLPEQLPTGDDFVTALIEYKTSRASKLAAGENAYLDYALLEETIGYSSEVPDDLTQDTFSEDVESRWLNQVEQSVSVLGAIYTHIDPTFGGAVARSYQDCLTVLQTSLLNTEPTNHSDISSEAFVALRDFELNINAQLVGLGIYQKIGAFYAELSQTHGRFVKSAITPNKNGTAYAYAASTNFVDFVGDQQMYQLEDWGKYYPDDYNYPYNATIEVAKDRINTSVRMGLEPAAERYQSTHQDVDKKPIAYADFSIRIDRDPESSTGFSLDVGRDPRTGDDYMRTGDVVGRVLRKERDLGSHFVDAFADCSDEDFDRFRDRLDAVLSVDADIARYDQVNKVASGIRLSSKKIQLHTDPTSDKDYSWFTGNNTNQADDERHRAA